jgi:hypothetical protein
MLPITTTALAAAMATKIDLLLKTCQPLRQCGTVWVPVSGQNEPIRLTVGSGSMECQVTFIDM